MDLDMEYLLIYFTKLLQILCLAEQNKDLNEYIVEYSKIIRLKQMQTVEYLCKQKISMHEFNNSFKMEFLIILLN